MGKRGRTRKVLTYPEALPRREDYTFPVDDPRFTVLARRARDAGVTLTKDSAAALADQRTQYELGRLYLAEAAQSGTGITREQHDAGLHVWRIDALFCRIVLGRDRHPRAPALEIAAEAGNSAIQADAVFAPSRTHAERVAGVRASYGLWRDAVLRGGGLLGVWEAERVCIHDLPCQRLAILRDVLDAVRDEFGMA